MPQMFFTSDRHATSGYFGPVDGLDLGGRHPYGPKLIDVSFVGPSFGRFQPKIIVRFDQLHVPPRLTNGFDARVTHVACCREKKEKENTWE
jgi:hypothetical protein